MGKHVIVIRPELVDITGSLTAGMVLSQILYWFEPNEKEQSKLRVEKHGKKWLAKKRTDWYSEIRLTEYQVDRALANLVSRGYIEIERHRFGGVPIAHIRPIMSAIESALNGLAAESDSISEQGTAHKKTAKRNFRTKTNVENLDYVLKRYESKPVMAINGDENLRATVSDWMEYKDEKPKGNHYGEKGLMNLLKKVSENSELFGSGAVCEAIERSMANTYSSIAWNLIPDNS